MNWKGTRVVVTGAGGFIGSHLTEELARRGARVRALVRYNSRGHWGFLEKPPRGVEVRPGDVTDASFVDELIAGQDVVFHLAALIGIPYSYVAPNSYVAVNVQGTLNVLQACRRRRVGKLVHTSTSEVYGTALYTPIDEKHPLQGQSPYSATKIAADHLAESFHRSFGLPVAVARPFNTYGPRQSARAVIPTIITQVLRDKTEIELGDPSPIRDFNYVADTVAGFIAVAQSPRSVGQVVNLGSGRPISVGAAAARVFELTGRRVRIIQDRKRVRPAKSEVRELLCDNGKARRLLGWRPRWSLDEGLVATIDYLQRHLDDYKEGYAV